MTMNYKCNSLHLAGAAAVFVFHQVPPQCWRGMGQWPRCAFQCCGGTDQQEGCCSRKCHAGEAVPPQAVCKCRWGGLFSQKCTEEENCSIKIPLWQHHCALELFLPPIILRHSNARKESLSFQTLFDIEVWSLGSWTALHCNISDVLFSHCCFKPSWERPFSFAWA